MSPLTTWILGIFLFVLIIFMISIGANQFQKMTYLSGNKTRKGHASNHPHHMHNNRPNIGGDPATWSPTHNIGGDPATWSPTHNIGGDPATWSPTR